MQSIEELLQHAAEIEAALGYSFKDRSKLALAFIHRSFVNENKEINQHNERLEFLGDAILGFLIAEYLYRYLPNTPEGDLSYLRSRIVEASSCIAYAQQLDIDRYLLLGKGERRNDGRGRDTIRADLFEALIGAIYLDGGIEAAKRFIFKNFSKQIEGILKKPLTNWKAELQDWCQKKYHLPPVYKVISESGPDHSKTFSISVLVNNEEVGSGVGSSKKEAQQSAAENASAKLEIQ